jgi:hypothetical protein
MVQAGKKRVDQPTSPDARRKLRKADAIITTEGLFGGRPIICCSMEFAFILNPILGTFHREYHPLWYFRFRVSAGLSSFHCAPGSCLIAIMWRRNLFRPWLAAIRTGIHFRLFH